MIKTISKITDFHFANYRFSFCKLQIFISFRFAPFRFVNYSKPSNQEVQENITSKSSALLFQIVKSAHLETIPWNLIIYENTAANSTHPDCRFRRTLRSWTFVSLLAKSVRHFEISFPAPFVRVDSGHYNPVPFLHRMNTHVQHGYCWCRRRFRSARTHG